MLICDVFTAAVGNASQTKKVLNSCNLKLRILDNVKWEK